MSTTEQYRRDGHTRVEGLMDAAEVAVYRPAVAAVVEQARAVAPPLAERSTYDKAFLQLMNLWRRDATIERFVRSPHLDSLVAERGFALTTHGAMRAGDATFHDGWTLHRATRNDTDTMRAVMTVIWFADGERVREPSNTAQRNDLVTWLPGCAPGDLAASPLNPVISDR